MTVIMPATPAWPPLSTPRLYVPEILSDGQERHIDGSAAHYLISVMRLKTGNVIKLFDDISGEWLAEITHTSKRDLILTVTAKLRARETVPDLWLIASPIKKARMDMLAEKSCELGIARFQPVITQRTNVDRVNVDRLRAQMIEAAEQCDRTALPSVEAPVKLAALLKDWPVERTLFFADEMGGMPMGEAIPAHPCPAAILIGPEGGFTPDERTLIRMLPQTVGVTLGPRILRAETAAFAAISLWMAANGDWRHGPGR
jgi:16S rRNA (uracil1498-N3)-methyltransferase